MVSISHWGMFPVEGYAGSLYLHCGRKHAHLVWLDWD